MAETWREILHCWIFLPRTVAPRNPHVTWDAVQAMLRSNSQGNRTRSNAKEPSLLAGLLYDQHGNRFTPTHAVKSGKRYRYYVVGQAAVSGAIASGFGGRD